MNTPHKHAELIKKWADGALIQHSENGKYWSDCDRPPTWTSLHYRVKPEVTTSLSNEQLYAISTEVWKARRLDHDPLDTAYRAHRAVADAAIKQYIKEQGK